MAELSRIIMRRVYYAYALRLLLHRTTLHAAAIVAVVAALSLSVSFGAIWHNFTQIPVGSIGTFIYGAFVNTDAWTLLGSLTLVVLGISFVRSVSSGPARPVRFA